MRFYYIRIIRLTLTVRCLNTGRMENDVQNDNRLGFDELSMKALIVCRLNVDY